MKKVIIFGGSFNPIHKAHLAIAKNASRILDAEVWFDVSEKPRWKDSFLSKRKRERLVSLAIKGNKNFKVFTEIPITGHVTYTIDTMLYLVDKYPTYKFYFLIGTDQVNKLDKWKDVDELAKLVQFVYVKRPGYQVNEENLKRYNVIDVGLEGQMMASTEVRHGDFKLCPKIVEDTIRKEGLYFKDILKDLLKEKRFKHSLRVAKLAVKMAKANHLDVHKAYIAGIVHDCAKELSKKDVMRLMKKYFPEHLDENYAIYHQYLAPLIAKKYFGIVDENIYDAIQYHTTGKVGMDKLAKVIFCSDKTDPGRDYDSSFLIDRCLEDIEVGFAFTMVDNIEYLNKKARNILISEDTLKLNEEALKVKEKYLVKLIVKTIDEHFGRDITIIDVENVNPLVKYYINCDALSERQVKALASAVRDAIEEYHYEVHHVEGRDNPSWVLVDVKDIVVNIFKSDERGKYNIEKLLGDCPIYNYDEIMEDQY